jgi:hypothetical protein
LVSFYSCYAVFGETKPDYHNMIVWFAGLVMTVWLFLLLRWWNIFFGIVWNECQIFESMQKKVVFWNTIIFWKTSHTIFSIRFNNLNSPFTEEHSNKLSVKITHLHVKFIFNFSEHTPECDFYTQSIILTLTRVLFYAESDFHKQSDFEPHKSDFETYECYYVNHVSDFDTQEYDLDTRV